VLDVFCGTGAFGLEALSRGAAKAVFIDSAREALGAARHNASRMGALSQCEFLQANATQLPKARQGFELVFLDPPYHQKLLPPALSGLHAGGWLAQDAIVIIEHDEAETTVLPDGFHCVDMRRYGRAVVELIKRKS
jgi:16S rRNA (guanine966-N2)-methyltransferase